MNSAIRKCLSVLIIVSQLTIASARAEETGSLPPLKRLGRGVSDRKTGEKLQLACVGELREEQGERGCELLQFLKTDAGGEESLVGPVTDISDTEHSATRQIREELRCYGLYKHTVSGRFFLFSAGMLPFLGEKARGRCEKFQYSTLSEKEFDRQRAIKRKIRKQRTGILSFSLTVGIWGAMGAVVFAGITTSLALPASPRPGSPRLRLQPVQSDCPSRWRPCR